MNISSARAGACTLILSFLAGSHALAAEPRDHLSLAEAIATTLDCNSDLVSELDRAAIVARARQAAVGPSPSLSLELENFAGAGGMSGTDLLETTLSLTHVLELGGKRFLRGSVAAAGSELAVVEAHAHQLEVLANVTRRFVDVAAAQERVTIAAAAVEMTTQIVSELTSGAAGAVIDTASARGVAPHASAADVSQARIAWTRARIARGEAAAALRVARYALAASWGSQEPEFTAVAADLFTLGSVPAFAALVAALERNPNMLRLSSEAELRDLELRLARAEARPDIELSVGVRRFEENGSNALVAGFSLPLATFDRNRGAIKEALEQRKASDEKLESTRTQAHSKLYALYQRLTAARERVGLLRGEAITEGKRALRHTRDAFVRGLGSIPDMLAAQQALLELRAAAVDAAVDYHHLHAEIARLTSEPIAAEALAALLPQAGSGESCAPEGSTRM